MRGDRRLFHELALAIRPGELVHVAGANGSGKTSLLRILCGLAAPESGEVRFRGQSIGANREAYCADLVFIGHAVAIKDDLTPVENLRVRMALAGHGLAAPAARAALEQLGLAAVDWLPAKLLSQGQRRRITLARLVVAPQVAVWILDEPFAALDASAIRVVETAIAAHLDRGGIALITTHQDSGILARAAHRLDLGAHAC